MKYQDMDKIWAGAFQAPNHQTNNSISPFKNSDGILFSCAKYFCYLVYWCLIFLLAFTKRLCFESLIYQIQILKFEIIFWLPPPVQCSAILLYIKDLQLLNKGLCDLNYLHQLLFTSTPPRTHTYRVDP